MVGFLLLAENCSEVFLDSSIFAGLYIPQRWMPHIASVDEHRIDLHNASIGVRALHDITNTDGPNVFAVLKKSRRQNFVGDFVVSLSGTFPRAKHFRRLRAMGSVENTFFVVGVGAVNDLVLRYLFDSRFHVVYWRFHTNHEMRRFRGF